MPAANDAATKIGPVEPVCEPESGPGDRWVGRRVGNYVIDRPLARGGMGTVYVARHPQLGREVAVKFLSQNVSTEPELAARFLAEARVTASLNHPNIVEILDFGELDGELYYAMELLRGKSLRAVMREQGRLSVTTMRPYIEQICWALEAAHCAGIVHRDLKPANVLVLDGEPPRLKLLDFGIAKRLSSGPTQTRAGQVLGTATHMAPEQALGDPNLVTPKSDLYSLGVIAYEMLTGAPVFQHDSEVMLMIMHVRDAVRPIREQTPEVPAAVARLVEACLAKDPAARPASARALAEELGRALLTAEPADGGARVLAPERQAVLFGEQPTQRAAAPPVPAVDELPSHVISKPAAVAAPKPAPAAPRAVAAAPFAPAPVAVKAIAATLVSPPPPAPAATPRPTAGAAGERAPAQIAEATLSVLLSRLQRRGDFSAFARTAGEVSQKADANGVFSAAQLGESILKDYALTAKLLRVVNATYARRFNGKVYSVKHAIVILGFDRVRSLALSISLFKTSGVGKDPARVTESAISALVSGELARNLAGSARVNDEQATVCAMFKNLGRHLVLVHLPEHYDRLDRLVEQEGLSVSAAAKRVLGMSFDELGTAIAKNWRMPEQVVNAISATELPEGRLERSEDRVNALAAFSNELCDVVTREGADTRERALRDLLSKHKGLVHLDVEALSELLAEVEASLGERYASLLGNDLASSRFVANVAGAAGAKPSAAELAADEERARLPLEQRIKEVKESLERGQASNLALGLALRIVAAHLGARAPMVLTLGPDRQHLMVRFALRDDVEGLKRELKFPLRATGGRMNALASAYNGGKDLVLKDCFAKEGTDTLPPCYFEILGAPSLALIACAGKAATPAFVLVDADTPEGLPDPARVAELAELRPLIARAAARS